MLYYNSSIFKKEGIEKKLEDKYKNELKKLGENEAEIKGLREKLTQVKKDYDETQIFHFSFGTRF